MALVFSVPVAIPTPQGQGAGRIDHAVKGTKTRHVNMQRTDPTFANDYPAGGFPIRANAKAIGFNTIYFAVGLSSQKNPAPGTTPTSGNTTTLSGTLHFTWDDVNGRLRAFTLAGVEETGTNLTQWSSVQMMVVGV